MSYILDALRKADAERERGQVPDLHAQTILRGPALAPPSAGARPWIWTAAGAIVVTLATLAWALLGREAPREPAVTAAPAAPSLSGAAALPTMPLATVPTPAQLPASVALPPADPAAAAAPAAAVAAAPARQPGFARPLPEPRAAVPKSAKPAATGTAPSATPVPNPSGAAATNATAKEAAGARPAARAEPAVRASEPRVYATAELPDDIRRELPTLAVGGAMYSENAANRMLIINGQVFHERDKLSPNLTLVQIKLKSAVLDYKGYRYSISY
jgi:general secretion pathway protein B